LMTSMPGVHPGPDHGGFLGGLRKKDEEKGEKNLVWLWSASIAPVKVWKMIEVRGAQARSLRTVKLLGSFGYLQIARKDFKTHHTGQAQRTRVITLENGGTDRTEGRILEGRSCEN